MGGGEMNLQAVSIDGLSVSFAGRKILDGVSLNAEQGELTVIVGPSGSGKTTLLRAINRLNECFQGSATEGKVGLSLATGETDAYSPGMDLGDLRRRAAMVFQNPNPLPMSIERNFGVPLRSVLRLNKEQQRERMERALKEVELWADVKDRLQENALKLSGGQQQRLCLARALAMDPEILLLDEPTANLDFLATEGIEKLLVSLKQRYTLLAVSHDLDQAWRVADRVVVLSGGKTVLTLDREQMGEHAAFRERVKEVF